MNQISKYSNYNALEADVISIVVKAIANGSSPEIAYRNGRAILDHYELLVEPRPYGVKGMGERVSPYTNLDNEMRKSGYANLVEPHSGSARAEISW